MPTIDETSVYPKSQQILMFRDRSYTSVPCNLSSLEKIITLYNVQVFIIWTYVNSKVIYSTLARKRIVTVILMKIGMIFPNHVSDFAFSIPDILSNNNNKTK